jgi:uncharacterized protein YbcV (DUF1398 family)
MAAKNETLSKKIRQVWHDVHAPNGLSFPLAVGRLMELGVQRYHVDYVGQTITAYAGEEVDIAPVALEKVEGTHEWSADKIRTALSLVQAGKTSYTEFSKGAIEAGVTDYHACISGKRVVYMSALGDIYVELFPGQKKE